MLIHMKSTTSFRLSEWNKAGSSHEMYFKTDKLKYNLVPLIDFLSKTIYNVGRCFVYRTTFSLVNVVSPISNLSYGTELAPYNMLNGNHLQFTFSFSSRWSYLNQRPAFQLRPYPHTVLWGNSLYTSSDFMTIDIPKTVMRDVGITTVNVREITWLYMFVGAFTKSFVNRSMYYNENNSGAFNETNTAKQDLYHHTIPNLFKQFPYADWIYSDMMWKMAPNVLHPNSVDDKFAYFYCLKLLQYYGKYTTANVVEIERKVKEYLRGEVLKQIEGEYRDVVDMLSERASARTPLPPREEVERYVNTLLTRGSL